MLSRAAAVATARQNFAASARGRTNVGGAPREAKLAKRRAGDLPGSAWCRFRELILPPANRGGHAGAGSRFLSIAASRCVDAVADADYWCRAHVPATKVNVVPFTVRYRGGD